MDLTYPERRVLDYCKKFDGEFLLDFVELQKATGLSQENAGYAAENLRCEGVISIRTAFEPRRTRYCRVLEGGK
jgi:hypothetical protein